MPIKNPCIGCTIRQKIITGCCVQGNIPEGAESKTLILRKNNSYIIRRVEVCEYLDVITGECVNYYFQGEFCRGFNNCERLG